MSVRFLCTCCTTSIKAKDQYSGKMVRCPHCRERILVPTDDQPNDVLELGEDYGLAAMSVGDIEIDSPEMHSDRTKAMPMRAQFPDLPKSLPLNPPDERIPRVHRQMPADLNAADPSESYSLLLRVSLSLRVLAACAAVVWLYLLGGELIEFTVGGQDATKTDATSLSSWTSLLAAFFVGASTVCMLAGGSEALRVLLDIRNVLARSQRS